MSVPELLVVLAVGLPAVGGVAAWLLRGRTSDLVALGAGTAGLLAAAALAVLALTDGVLRGWWGMVRIDALGGWTLLIVCGSAVAAYAGSVAWLDHERRTRVGTQRPGRERGLYWLLLLWFVAGLCCVPLTDDLGLVWVAIEGTTIASALLIGFSRSRDAIEAAWKTLILGSVGVGFALLGTVLAYASSVTLLGATSDALAWTRLVAVAPGLDPGLMRIAFVFALVGYGTKAGLVPFHTWLPDAHSQAPGPVSALLSGATLAVALLALARFHVVASGTLGSGFSSDLLVLVGLLSLALAVPFLIAQGDVKRLLAYSSIEHLGLSALALGFGGTLALTGLALHLLGHALAKSSVFVSAGGLVEAAGSRHILRLEGITRRERADGRAFLVGSLLLGGLPPSVLFVSELVIIIGGLQGAHAWAAAIAAGLLALAFVGMSFHVLRVGVATRRGRRHLDGSDGEGPRRRRFRMGLALVAPLAIVALLGVWTPPPVQRAVDSVVAVLEGHG